MYDVYKKILGSAVQPWYTVVKSSSLLYGLEYKFEPSWASTSFPVEKNLCRVCKVAWLSYRYLFKIEEVVVETRDHTKERSKKTSSNLMMHSLHNFSSRVSPKKLFQIPIWNFPPKLLHLETSASVAKSNCPGYPTGEKKNTHEPDQLGIIAWVVFFLGESHSLWSFY